MTTRDKRLLVALIVAVFVIPAIANLAQLALPLDGPIVGPVMAMVVVTLIFAVLVGTLCWRRSTRD